MLHQASGMRRNVFKKITSFVKVIKIITKRQNLNKCMARFINLVFIISVLNRLRIVAKTTERDPETNATYYVFVHVKTLGLNSVFFL